jgi:hypothetical protein
VHIPRKGKRAVGGTVGEPYRCGGGHRFSPALQLQDLIDERIRGPGFTYAGGLTPGDDVRRRLWYDLGATTPEFLGDGRLSGTGSTGQHIPFHGSPLGSRAERLSRRDVAEKPPRCGTQPLGCTIPHPPVPPGLPFRPGAQREGPEVVVVAVQAVRCRRDRGARASAGRTSLRSGRDWCPPSESATAARSAIPGLNQPACVYIASSVISHRSTR